MCVWGGGGLDDAISKLKGAGAKHALPRSYLHLSWLSRPETIGRHLRASNKTIHSEFGIMILILRL